MEIKIIAKSFKGEEAIRKMDKDKSYHVAKKNIIMQNPLTILITLKIGMLKYVKPDKYIKGMVNNVLETMMNDYGASKEDFTWELN